ncbi:MAG TPA: hypothetical protein PLP75_01185 [Burkholderiales bacterium]|nr:hypothetical protein [Burkholderiales bacterium]
MRNKVILSWSGGKDSALALYKLMNNPEYEIVGLLTITFNHKDNQDYVAMHMIHIDLIKQQALKLGIELFIIEYEDNVSYECKMRDFLTWCVSQNVKNIAFGDIHLIDLRKKREEKLKQLGINAVFPLWGISGTCIIHQFFSFGFKGIIVNVDTDFMNIEMLGTDLNIGILEQNVKMDPCGELGEYHTLVYDGPIFTSQINYTLQKIISLDQGNRFFSIASIAKKIN